MPVISALTYTVTDTTIVAVWTTDVSSDSNIFAGAKAGIDNGVAANSTAHQAIVTGLVPNTAYSCHVTSGGTSSSPQSVTTNPAQNRIPILSGSMRALITEPSAPQGDTYRTFVSNDNNTYITQDDGYGFVSGSPNSGYNTQLGVLTNESTFAGTLVSLANYLGENTLTGTDGPGGTAMGNKSTGLFGMLGNLYAFVYRQYPPSYTTNRYCNWIKSTDHGATWNNFTAKTTFDAAGNPVQPYSAAEPVQFYVNTIGIVTPVLYAADDGTMGYNTAGNQIDGANGFVYMSFLKDTAALYMMRLPRINFDAQDASEMTYWVGPSSPAPADFVNDSNWSSSPTSTTNILPTAQLGAWWQIGFIPGLNSYIMTTWATASPGSMFTFYAAPTPAGPWTEFFSQHNPTTGSVFYGPFPFHRDLLSNTATDNIPVRIIYQGESSGSNYRPNWSTLVLSTTEGPSTPVNTFVQGAGTTTSSGSVSSLPLAFGSNVASGDLLICSVRHATGGTISSITDTITNTWTIVYDTSDTGGTVLAAWAYTFSKASGANTVTLHFSAPLGAQFCIAEYNGPVALRVASAIATSGGTNSTPATSNAITTVAGDLLIGSIEMAGGGAPGSLTPSSGMTIREAGSVSGTDYILITDNLNSPGGSQTAGVSGFTATSWAAGIAAFNAAEYSISGNAGIAGATVSYSGTSSGSVTAGAGGSYTIPNLFNGSYTITPSLTGYTFSPTNSNQTVSGSNITGVNFTATQVQVATPTFSPVAGSYSSTQNVTISSTDSGLSGFAITYTTDGSTPIPGSHGTVYTTPVAVASSLTIKAVASATSYANSAEADAAYTISSATAYSVPDCRVTKPNSATGETVNGTILYDSQTSSNPAIPPTDSRVSKPVACGTYPQNSRTPGTYGPGE